MTIGAKITELRAQHNMSQGDLAEKLNVSRQSISKWETNTSIPELDKLIQLSDLFHISIDDLVRDNDLQQPQEEMPTDAPEASEPEQPPIQQQHQEIVQKPTSERKIVSFILLGVGLICFMLGFVFGNLLFIAGAYFLFCSILCYVMKRYGGLICIWIPALLFLFAGGNYIRFDYYLKIRLVVIAILAVFSIWKFSKEVASKQKGQK